MAESCQSTALSPFTSLTTRTWANGLASLPIFPLRVLVPHTTQEAGVSEPTIVVLPAVAASAWAVVATQRVAPRPSCLLAA